jgi:hypothetical protein
MKNTIYCFLVYLCIIALSSRAKAQGAGYTLQFDGVNDYVEVAANASLNITSAITIEAWVNKYTNVQWASVMTKGKPSYPTDLFTNNYTLHFDSLGGLIFSDNISLEPPSSLVFPLNEWHHVALTWDGNVFKYYIDGICDSVQSPFTGKLIPNDSNLTIGADFPGGAEYFHGQLTEVRLWNIARTQQQIQDNMHLRLTGSYTGLVGCWRFDEGNGKVAVDYSGHGNTGILINGPVWVTSSVPLTSAESLEKNLPFTFDLKQNYPNPFNPNTTIIFGIPTLSQVTLIIYDLLGKEVAALVHNETMSAGSYTKQWNAAAMPGGVYFYRLQVCTFAETKKLILLK